MLSFDGVPTVLDDIWLPGAVFRASTAERIAAYHGPLYGLFESEFATPMTRAEERIRAVAADAPWPPISASRSRARRCCRSSACR